MNLKTVLYIGLSILVIITLKVSYSYIYDKGYNVGYKTYEDMYKDKLAKDVANERTKIQQEYDSLLEKMKSIQKVEVVYKDRIKLVKQVVSADNMKCEMTDDQVKKLNEFIKFK